MTHRALGIAMVAAACLAGTASAADWARYGGDAQLTNDVPTAQSGGIDASTASRLHTRWSTVLDGAVIASPLFAESAVPGERHGVVYAATQAGSLYALSAQDGRVLWKRDLGTAASTCDEEQAGVGATYGIVSTGVVDRARGVLYVIGASGLLYALDLATGATAPGWPVRIVSATSGELVWGGLTLAGDRLYVPIASYCDAPGADGAFADGRLVAVDVGSRTITGSFDVVPGPDDMGGIWGYGGSSVDPLTGDVWTATGNSWVYEAGCGCIVEDVGNAESVVQLDPDLNVLAADRPPEIPGPVEDTDFGSTPLLFQPQGCPPLAAANAKNGLVYVWRRDSLATGPIWSFRAGPDDLLNPFIAEPSWAPELNTLYIADARAYDATGATVHFDAVEAFTVGPGCALPNTPTWTAPDVGRGPKAPPLIVGDTLFVNGGYEPALHILDAGTGRLIGSFSLAGSAFSPPAFADGEVVVGDVSGTVTAFGIGSIPGARHFPFDG